MGEVEGGAEESGVVESSVRAKMESGDFLPALYLRPGVKRKSCRRHAFSFLCGPAFWPLVSFMSMHKWLGIMRRVRDCHQSREHMRTFRNGLVRPQLFVRAWCVRVRPEDGAGEALPRFCHQSRHSHAGAHKLPPGGRASFHWSCL